MRGAIFHALLNREGSIFIVVTIVIDIVDDVKCSRGRIIAARVARGKESTGFRIVARNTRIQIATGSKDFGKTKFSGSKRIRPKSRKSATRWISTSRTKNMFYERAYVCLLCRFGRRQYSRN